jgi:hypothetical protein
MSSLISRIAATGISRSGSDAGETGKILGPFVKASDHRRDGEPVERLHQEHSPSDLSAKTAGSESRTSSPNR